MTNKRFPELRRSLGLDENAEAQGELKICRDCRHARNMDNELAEPTCELTRVDRDLVTGNHGTLYIKCQLERAVGRCGIEAKNFEAKPQQAEERHDG